MAEVSSLTNAHAHARLAIDQQNHQNWSQAADEHEKASSEFLKTSRTTTDTEALRVLKLLEDQHRRLARIIKSHDDPIEAEPSALEQQQAPQAAGPSQAPSDATTKSIPKSSSSITAARMGSQIRESSPSLARDIASRRGIPQARTSQPSAAAQARARDASPESRRRSQNGAGPKIPPSIVDSVSSRTTAKQRPPASQDDDEGFAKFYSSITTGTLSKLSSALAFAGLPLNTSQESLPSSPKSTSKQRTVKVSNEPDVTRIFSKATLEAVEDEHRSRGNMGHGFGPAESFYVVQKGGGTYSYADITRAAQQHNSHQHPSSSRNLSGIDEEDDDAFVDAKEVPGSPISRHSSNSNRASSSKQKLRPVYAGTAATNEELQLENATLKQTLGDLASRLSAFEAHAQDASMAALTQSMASLQRPAPGGADAERVRLLEKQIEAQADEKIRLETLAAKQKEMLKRYQSKWEEVKKSAKEKDRVKREREREREKGVEKGGREGNGEEGVAGGEAAG